MKRIPKPVPGEYAPYTIKYIDLLPDDGLILNHLQDQLDDILKFVHSLPEEKLTHRRVEGEWTTKEILLHISDDERIYCYRALRFARNDSTDLPGFEQDDFVHYSDANQRELESILTELSSVRLATLTFFNSLNETALSRIGTWSGNPMSVRAAAYHIAGHAAHHIHSLQGNYSSFTAEKK